MSQSCSVPGCTSGRPVLIKSRGACNPCYMRIKQRDDFVPSRDVSTYHRITEVDAESRAAICSICGPTTAILRGEDGGRRRWRCAARWQPHIRSYYLKRDYDLTQEQYDEMVKAQDGGCAICRKPESDGRDLSVEHCHETGRPRGLLCWQCNTAIGKLGDTAAGVRAALAYLEAADAAS